MDWEAFEAESEAAGRTAPHRGCAVGKLLADLDSKDREILQRVLSNPEVSHEWISRTVRERKLATIRSPETFRRHRRNLCSCKENEE